MRSPCLKRTYKRVSGAGLFSTVLDFFFPPYCLICGSENLYHRDYLVCVNCIQSIPLITHPFCSRCGKPFATESNQDHLCSECLTGDSYLSMVRALCKYEGSVTAMIHQFKYKQKFACVPLFTLMLELNHSIGLTFSSYDSLIPIPLHRTRLKERGFNQSVLWGKMLGKKYQVPLELRTLKRVVPTLPQVSLQGRARKNNVRNAFALNNAAVVRNKAILLLDDVYTTGATMNECARVLKQSGASRVDGFVIARAV
jgi:ComF family protein